MFLKKLNKQKISLLHLHGTMHPSHSASLMFKAPPRVILLWKDKLHEGLDNKMMTQAMRTSASSTLAVKERETFSNQLVTTGMSQMQSGH